jgi:hypothetical protein
MINPEIIYLSSNLKYVPAKITVDNTSAIKIAIPPSVGVALKCDVRTLGLSQRFFNLEIFTIDGTVNHVMTNAIKNPSTISKQSGIKIEYMLTAKFTLS